jgi:hypothetical protein
MINGAALRGVVNVMISLENSIRRNKAAMTVLESLSKGAVFRLAVGGDNVNVSRETSGISFENPTENVKPDFEISIPEDIFLELFSEKVSSISVEDYLTFSARLLADKGKGNVRLVVYSNFLKLTFHGYPKLIKLGGPSFWKVLKENGVGSIFAIEKKLATFRNK